MTKKFGDHTKLSRRKFRRFFLFTKIVLCYKKKLTFFMTKILMAYKNLVAKPNYDEIFFLTQHLLKLTKMCTNFMTKVFG